MRGEDVQQLGVFSYVSAEDRIAKDHPLRAIRGMVDAALGSLSIHFDTLYAAGGRRSIAPEKLLRALLLQALYSVRSERQLMEQLDYNLLFRWFVGLNLDDAIWDVTVFTKNRERLLRGEVAERLLLAVVEQAHARQLLSEEHFTIDGTLIQAWANRRSFKEKADPLLERMRRRDGPITLGADKGYQEEGFLEQLRARRVAPHVAEYEPNPKWPSFLTEAERNDPGFRISQKKRKLVEKVFGWAKLDRGLRQVKLRGLRRVDWLVQLVATAHNLRRMQTLLSAA